MCIYVKTKTPKVAEQDIECCKILLHDTKEDTYIAPFRMTDYTKNIKGIGDERVINDQNKKPIWNGVKDEGNLSEIDVLYQINEDGVVKTEEGDDFFYCNYDPYRLDDRYRDKPYRYDTYGYIHTHADIKGAMDSIMNIEMQMENRKDVIGDFLNNKEIAFFKCVIPKGTEYLEGYHEDGYDIYASRRIVVCEELDLMPTAEQSEAWNNERKMMEGKYDDNNQCVQGKYFHTPFISYDNIRHTVEISTYRYVVLHKGATQELSLPCYQYDLLLPLTDEVLEGKVPLTVDKHEMVKVLESSVTNGKITNVVEGFFPVYNDYISALEFVIKEKNKRYHPEDYEIYECLIRYGTPYYIGLCGKLAVKEVTLTRKMRNDISIEDFYVND